jgi:hypothetical protein
MNAVEPEATDGSQTQQAGDPQGQQNTQGEKGAEPTVPPEDGDEDPVDGLSGSEARGHDGATVARSIRAKNAAVNSNIRIETYIAGDRERLAVQALDLSDQFEIANDTYVAPDWLPQLSQALVENKVIVLVGAACGKWTTAGVALSRANNLPVVQMPSDIAIRGLVEAIEDVCKRSPKAGILLEEVDSETLVRLASFDMRRLRSVILGGARIVLTVKSLQGIPEKLDGVTSIQCSSPPLGRVIEKAAGAQDAKNRAIEALGRLAGHQLSPGHALDLLHDADESQRSPDELAQMFDSKATDAVLEQWLSTDRSARQVASLVAAATLAGVPIVDVDLVSETLSGIFSSDLEEPSEGIKVFRVADRGWPDGMVDVTRKVAGTHFGYQDIEIVTICPPHTRSRIIEHLWRRLGSDFRQPFVVWMGGLADHSTAGIRLGAAFTAGILFTIDPVIAERDLIRPWALDERFTHRLCAAVALGVPVVTGTDPAAARALTKAWSTSPDARLQHVAVLAYGGPLGAWDPVSAAPTHLWRIAAETPQLARSANVSLASLMAAGASAARIRAAVLGTLSAQADIERVPRRVYALMPLIMRHLTAAGQPPRESLKELIESPQETDTFSMFGTLLAAAFIAPPGYDYAQNALDVLLRGVADGRVEQTSAFTILTQVRGAARDAQKQRALDARLKRALWASVRARSASAGPARTAIDTFFPASQGDNLAAL